MKILNAVLALLAAVGIYMVFLGIYSYIAVTISARRRGLLDDGVSSVPESIAPDFKHQLEQMLYQARLDVSVQEFLLLSTVLGAAAGGCLFFATGSLLVAGLAFLTGMVLYVIVLNLQRQKNLDAYESAMPNALRDMRSAFRMRGLSLVEALRYVAEHGPEVVRPDFQELTAAFSGSSIDMSRIQRLMGLRGSYALDRVTEVMLQFNVTPQRIPEILDLLIPRLRKEVAIRREMSANISGPKRELLIVVLMPFAIVIFFRFAAPSYAEFYRSFFGQILLLFAWVFDVVIYLLATVMVRRIVNPIPYQRGVPERRRVLLRKKDESEGKVPEGEGMQA